MSWYGVGMQRGRCELCRAVGELHNSHYLPRGGYRRLRAPALKNPNPVVISGGKVKQSSLQVRDYKFCADCEQRLNSGGEGWIPGKISQDYAAPLWIHGVLDLAKSKAVRAGDSLLFPQAAIPEVDVSRLTYFGLSIFWRGTRSWSSVDGGRPPKIYLGQYEQSVRMFYWEGEAFRLRQPSRSLPGHTKRSTKLPGCLRRGVDPDTGDIGSTTSDLYFCFH
jgi:hypothetical protein